MMKGVFPVVLASMILFTCSTVVVVALTVVGTIAAEEESTKSILKDVDRFLPTTMRMSRTGNTARSGALLSDASTTTTLDRHVLLQVHVSLQVDAHLVDTTKDNEHGQDEDTKRMKDSHEPSGRTSASTTRKSTLGLRENLRQRMESLMRWIVQVTEMNDDHSSREERHVKQQTTLTMDWYSCPPLETSISLCGNATYSVLLTVPIPISATSKKTPPSGRRPRDIPSSKAESVVEQAPGGSAWSPAAFHEGFRHYAVTLSQIRWTESNTAPAPAKHQAQPLVLLDQRWVHVPLNGEAWSYHPVWPVQLHGYIQEPLLGLSPEEEIQADSMPSSSCGQPFVAAEKTSGLPHGRRHPTEKDEEKPKDSRSEGHILRWFWGVVIGMVHGATWWHRSRPTGAVELEEEDGENDCDHIAHPEARNEDTHALIRSADNSARGFHGPAMVRLPESESGDERLPARNNLEFNGDDDDFDGDDDNDDHEIDVAFEDEDFQDRFMRWYQQQEFLCRPVLGQGDEFHCESSNPTRHYTLDSPPPRLPFSHTTTITPSPQRSVGLETGGAVEDERRSLPFQRHRDQGTSEEASCPSTDTTAHGFRTLLPTFDPACRRPQLHYNGGSWRHFEIENPTPYGSELQEEDENNQAEYDGSSSSSSEDNGSTKTASVMTTVGNGSTSASLSTEIVPRLVERMASFQPFHCIIVREALDSTRSVDAEASNEGNFGATHDPDVNDGTLSEMAHTHDLARTTSLECNADGDANRQVPVADQGNHSPTKGQVENSNSSSAAQWKAPPIPCPAVFLGSSDVSALRTEGILHEGTSEESLETGKDQSILAPENHVPFHHSEDQSSSKSSERGRIEIDLHCRADNSCNSLREETSTQRSDTMAGAHGPRHNSNARKVVDQDAGGLFCENEPPFMGQEAAVVASETSLNDHHISMHNTSGKLRETMTFNSSDAHIESNGKSPRATGGETASQLAEGIEDEAIDSMLLAELVSFVPKSPHNLEPLSNQSYASTLPPDSDYCSKEDIERQKVQEGTLNSGAKHSILALDARSACSMVTLIKYQQAEKVKVQVKVEENTEIRRVQQTEIAGKGFSPEANSAEHEPTAEPPYEISIGKPLGDDLSFTSSLSLSTDRSCAEVKVSREQVVDQAEPYKNSVDQVIAENMNTPLRTVGQVAADRVRVTRSVRCNRRRSSHINPFENQAVIHMDVVPDFMPSAGLHAARANVGDNDCWQWNGRPETTPTDASRKSPPMQLPCKYPSGTSPQRSEERTRLIKSPVPKNSATSRRKRPQLSREDSGYSKRTKRSASMKVPPSANKTET